MLAGPAGSVILHKLRGDRRMIVQPDVAEAMRLCGPFRTLDAHARSIMEAMPALKDHAEHTLQTLSGLAEAGLLESSETAWKRLTQPTDTAVTETPCRIFILTCDRPSALNRLLSGLREYPLPDAVEGIWIIDDSRQAESIQENGSIIQAQAEGAKVPVVHADLNLREDLIQHLKTALPEHRDSIEWLLERSVWGSAPTYGIARNMALLLSIGKRALVLDDDIIPQAIAPPLSRTGLRFGTANDREAVFFASREALTQHAMPLTESPLAMMLGSLGRSLGTLLPLHLCGHEDLLGFDGELLDRHHSGSRTLITQCGSWGDSGTGNGNWIFNLPSSSVKKLVAQPDGLSLLLSARSNWLGYRGPVLSQYGTISQVTGLDHASLLPPYIPAERGEDIMFGIMVQRLHPDSAVWNEGWAVRHEPLEERARRSDLTPLSAIPDLSLLTDWLGREPRDQWGITPEQRLNSLAEQVRRLANMESDALETLVKQELVSKTALLLSQCVARIRASKDIEDLPSSQEWTHFLTQSRDKLVSEIQDPKLSPAPASLGGVGNFTGQDLRSHGFALSKALLAWPSLCAAAVGFSM